MRTARAIVLFALAIGGVHPDASAGQRRTEPVRIDSLTATIGGRVTSETGGPIRRAEVRAISEVGLTRVATTDTDGRYLVRDLPAGTFTLHVSKSGFVPLYFGQRRPFEGRRTVLLAEGQRGTADVRLPRAGAITGRIVDSIGEPVMGARVQALRRRMVNGQRGLQASGAGDTTDDTGAYRLYGLPPGEYYVTATPRRIEDRTGRLVIGAIPGRGAPIFYPGTANRDEAQRITVDVSGEARADMQLVDVRTSRVTGIVLASDGAPAAGAMISLLSRDLDFGGSAGEALLPLQIQDDAAADGSFELTGVPPGSFTLRAQTRPNMSAFFDIPNQRIVGPAAQPVIESALVPVVVDGDIAGLTVTTSRSGTIDVTLVADQGVTAPLPRGVRVTVRTSDANAITMNHNSPDGATMLLTLAGPSRVSVEGLPENWVVKAIMLDNQDVTDTAIDVRNGRQNALKVVLTDRVTDVVGSIASSSSFADPGNTGQAMVVIFADDETKWTYPSRFVRSVRASEKGTFQAIGLPANMDYRAIAVDHLEDGEETDPEFLKRMRERATRFSLFEGQRRAVDLRLIQR